jgi:hypothetical protein
MASFRSNEGFSSGGGWRSKGEGGGGRSRHKHHRPEWSADDAAAAAEGGEYLYGLQSVEAALARFRAQQDRLAGSEAPSDDANRDVNLEGCHTISEKDDRSWQEGRQARRLYLQLPGRDEQSPRGDHGRGDDDSQHRAVNGKRSESIQMMANELNLPVDYLPRPSLSK